MDFRGRPGQLTAVVKAVQTNIHQLPEQHRDIEVNQSTPDYQQKRSSDKITHLEQQAADLRLQLEERGRDPVRGGAVHLALHDHGVDRCTQSSTIP